MKFQTVVNVLSREWLLLLSGLALVFVSLYSGRLPIYSVHELQVLYFLFILFVTVKGLEHSSLLLRVSQHFEQGRFISAKLVVLTFALSMLVTNDVALVVVVPLTMLLRVRRLGLLVILEALSANAGSALTPFGNPQNLFIYWFYNLSALSFVKTIAPLTLVSFVVLLLVALTIRVESIREIRNGNTEINWRAYVYLAGLLLVILAILHLLPWWSAIAVSIFVLVFDRRSLAVDYSLLVSFVFLFGLADNLDSWVQTDLTKPDSVFMYSALASQVISNVPATVLLARLTEQWPALLWGVSVGGFGSLVGSLANIIAYRIYLRQLPANQVPVFTLQFFLIGYAAFIVSGLLYFAWLHTV